MLFASTTMTIRTRIARGYILVLGLALTGTTTGLLVGSHVRKRALAIQELAIAERKLLSDLQVKILYNRPTKQLSPYLNDSVGFEEASQAFLDRVSNIEVLLQEHRNIYDAKKLFYGEQLANEHRLLHDKLTGYEDALTDFSQRLGRFRTELNVLIANQSDIGEARQLLITFVQGSEFAAFVQFPDQLTPFVSQAEQAEREAALIVEKAIALETQIIMGSLLLSIAIAAMMALVTSQAIAQPIQTITTIARQVTEESNFDLQVPTQGEDEVASLAQSFNRMIRQVNQLLTQLNAKNADLESALTQLNQQQLQLVQAEKMSSLGKLVAGIAHEINNPVNFVHGNLIHVQRHTDDLIALVELYQHHYPEPSECLQQEIEDIDLAFIHGDLSKILTSMRLGTERIRQIVLSLRNFSRMDESEFKTVDIHDGLENTLLLLQHRLSASPNRQDIQLIKAYGELPRIECSPGHLNQVFMNILTNAIEAIESASTQCAKSPEGLQQPAITQAQITLRTTLLMVETAPWVQIEISDNGPGMSVPTQKSLFEPFFTTKPVGQGTGMGMSLSYQIITDRHQGTLACSSTLGRGTTIVIKIPCRQISWPADASLAKPEQPPQRVKAAV